MLSTVRPCQEQGPWCRPSKECSGQSAPNQREAWLPPWSIFIKIYLLHKWVGEDGDASPCQATHRLTVVGRVFNHLFKSLPVQCTLYIQMHLYFCQLLSKHHLVSRSASFDDLMDRNALHHRPFQASCSHLTLPRQDLLLRPHLIYVHCTLSSWHAKMEMWKVSREEGRWQSVTVTDIYIWAGDSWSHGFQGSQMISGDLKWLHVIFNDLVWSLRSQMNLVDFNLPSWQVEEGSWHCFGTSLSHI